MKNNQDLEGSKVPKDLPLINILMIGDSQSGKSSLSDILTRRGYSKFLENQNVTSIDGYGKLIKNDKTKGCDILATVRQTDQSRYCLKIYDLTGDKTQRNYLDLYLARIHTQIHIIIFCFDVTNLRTLSHFKKWIALLIKNGDNNQTNVSSEDSNSYHAPASTPCNSEINITDENQSLVMYQQYKVIKQSSYQGMLMSQIAQTPILLVGTKLDMIPEVQWTTLKTRIAKQVGFPLYQKVPQIHPCFEQCEEGANIFLIGLGKLYENHSEMLRLDQCINKISTDILLKRFNNIYQLQSNALLQSDQLGSISRNMAGPFVILFRGIQIYFKNFYRRLFCKKKQA